MFRAILASVLELLLVVHLPIIPLEIPRIYCKMRASEETLEGGHELLWAEFLVLQVYFCFTLIVAVIRVPLLPPVLCNRLWWCAPLLFRQFNSRSSSFSAKLRMLLTSAWVALLYASDKKIRPLACRAQTCPRMALDNNLALDASD